MRSLRPKWVVGHSLRPPTSLTKKKKTQRHRRGKKNNNNNVTFRRRGGVNLCGAKTKCQGSGPKKKGTKGPFLAENKWLVFWPFWAPCFHFGVWWTVATTDFGQTDFVVCVVYVVHVFLSCRFSISCQPPSCTFSTTIFHIKETLALFSCFGSPCPLFACVFQTAPPIRGMVGLLFFGPPKISRFFPSQHIFRIVFALWGVFSWNCGGD